MNTESKTKDRHENKNWEFRQAKADPAVQGQFVRLYRSTQNPNIFKRVAKRSGTTSHQWESVSYTMKGQVDRYGRMFWVRSVEEAMMIPQRNAEMEEIYKRNES